MKIAPDIIDGLERMAPGRVLVDEPMARHTSFGLGGPADVFLRPLGELAFKECAALLDDGGVPTMVLGRGTNLLVRDGGVDGAVLSSEDALGDVGGEGTTVRVGSGLLLSKLLSYCASRGLSGLEGLSGIPGSVGGAVVMNAGSFGVSIADRLTEIVVFEPGGASARLRAADLEIGYRRISLPPGAIVESASLKLEQGDGDEIAARQKEILERKWRMQPSGMRSAGCIFRNPGGQSAGRLIDQAGLKGARVGGAVVSDRHANFILNDRAASSDDVERLIERVRDRVRVHAGVELELEVEIVGRTVN